MQLINVKEDLANKIEEALTSDQFAWYFAPSTNSPLKNAPSKTVDGYQFSHVFYKDEKINSPHFYLIEDLFHATIISQIKQILRIKGNFLSNLTRSSKENFQYPHQDVKSPQYKSFLYYVNDADGDTLFFDKNYKIKKRIKPKKGQAILFNSNCVHATTFPVKTDYRIVINTVFK